MAVVGPFKMPGNIGRIMVDTGEEGNLDMGLKDLDFVEIPDEVPSPFIPGTNIQFAWDSTSLGYFKQCPQLYKYVVIDGYHSKEDNVHLRFGSEYHQAIADYRKSIAAGIQHDDAVFDVIKALMFRIDDWRPDHKYKNRLNLLHAVIGYLDSYQNDPVEVITLENGDPAVEYSFRFELEQMCAPDQPYVLCGHMDDVNQFNGDYFVRDHKTTTSTPGEYYWKQFEPNNQMTLYTIASRVILNKPAKGVIIDSAQILLTEPYVRFTRGITYRTEDQLGEWLFDLTLWLAQAKAYGEADYWPHNDTACNMYGGCRFRDVCASAPAIRDDILASDFEKGEPWNPLKPR
jgi:hypothetical protein